MRSHVYSFSVRQCLASIGAPLVGLMAAAIVIRTLFAVGLLPDPRPQRDMDHVVLGHRIQSSRQPASVILVGDSSCLTGVSARQLSGELGMPVVNLGSVSTLGLDDFGRLAAEAMASGVPHAVVLLVHPAFLRRPGPDPQMVALLEWLRRPEGRSPASRGWTGYASWWLGLDAFRDRVEPWVRPEVMPGAFGVRYGFSRDLLGAMDADGGGVEDPGRFNPGAAVPLPPLELSPRLEAAASRFGGQFPTTVTVAVGITPVPESLADPGEAARHRRALEALAGWLGPQVVPLEDLPAVLPDGDFASATHLNGAGREAFTTRLAAALQRRLPVPAAAR